MILRLGNSQFWWKFCIVVFALNSGDRVACSGAKGIEASGGKTSGLWGYISSFASSILSTKTDKEVSYGKLFQFERILQDKFQEMGTNFAKNPSTISEGAWNPIKFPEASAFSALFIRDIGGHLDTWMDLSETKKLHEFSKILSQHILWVRSAGSKAATSYFIYRPSFEAELDSSNILPHIKHHSEASETFQSVLEVVQQYPNDQIVFAGLQSGGIIAMLHSWMISASVPIVYHNLKEFKGELHQVKVFLFDSDCALSDSFAPNYPFPSWDVLRFYSGMTGSISPDRCRFESMKPIGLAYSFKPSWAEYLLSSSVHVDRSTFIDYYDKSLLNAESVRQSSSENIDNGIEEAFDETASVTASEISMSVDGNARARSFKASTAPIRNFEEIIKPGIELLKQSMSLSKFFYNNLKEIYKTHQTFYLRRNVSGCASAMQKSLINTLLGNERESPMIVKGIKDIVCDVESYNEKTKVALVLCSLEGKDGAKISMLRFRTHVQNEMEVILSDRSIAVVENEWEEISINGRSVSTSESYSVSGRSRANTQQRGVEDVYYDDRTLITGFQEKSEQWASCLDELFRSVPHLNAITPTTLSSAVSAANSVTSSARTSPGSSTLSIQLPFSSVTAVCEYSLLTQPKNFYQLYSVSSSMFFSIFSDSIETNAMPQVCNGVLEPPSIPHKNSGNAETFSRILNEYFNSDEAVQINHKNTIVNGLELQESITNLPSNNPYEIFNPQLCNVLSECLAKNSLDNHLYDCNSHLTLWAGRHHCPEVCQYRQPSPLGNKPIHLCSRVVNCGDGVFLGFRGCKTFGTERPLSEEFASALFRSQSMGSSAYFAAFHLKQVDGWSASLKKPFRFAVFLNEAARTTYIDQVFEPTTTQPSAAPNSSSASIQSLSKKIVNSSEHQQYHSDDDDLDSQEGDESEYYHYEQPISQSKDIQEQEYFEQEQDYEESKLQEQDHVKFISENFEEHQQVTDPIFIEDELIEQQQTPSVIEKRQDVFDTETITNRFTDSNEEVAEEISLATKTESIEKQKLLAQVEAVTSSTTTNNNNTKKEEKRGKKRNN